MSVKLCDNCTMIMVNYADLWLMHSHVARLLDGARLELRELKAYSRLLGACTTCPLLRSDLEASVVGLNPPMSVDRQHECRKARSLYPSALQLTRALRLEFVGRAT
jgi:hypothetical protein